MSMTSVISFYLVHLSMTFVISIDGLDDDVRCRTISFDHLKKGGDLNVTVNFVHVERNYCR